MQYNEVKKTLDSLLASDRHFEILNQCAAYSIMPDRDPQLDVAKVHTIHHKLALCWSWITALACRP